MIQRHVRRLCITLVLGSLVALGSFSVAFADGPTITGPFHFEDSFVLADCDSFQIIDSYAVDATITRFFDETGHPVRVIIQYQGTDTFTNSVTGKAYTGSFHDTLMLTREMLGIGAVNAGISLRLTLPGAGAVVLSVGVVLYIRTNDVELGKGPSPEGDYSDLCAALA
jgi:hypothetical protein